MNLCNPVLEACAFDIFRHLAILKGSFERDELPLLQNPGELREIPPGVDAMPFSPALVASTLLGILRLAV